MLAHTIALLHGPFLLVDDALLILQFLLRCIPHIIITTTAAAVVVRLQVTALNLSTTAAAAAASIAVNVLGIIYQVDFALKLHNSQRKSKLL